MKPLPTQLSEQVLAYAQVSLAPRRTLWRFYGALVLGAALTLLVCPQFGVGPWGGGHGISHWVMPYGAFACGVFCAAVFVGAGTLTGSVVLTRAEWRYVWRQHYVIVVPPLVALVIILMGIKLVAGLESLHETAPFYLGWGLMALVTEELVLRTMRVLRPI